MPFTPVQTFLGGLLLHLSTSSLLGETGRVFGISSVIDGAILGDHARWRWALITGLLSGPAIASATGLAAAAPDPGTFAYAAQPLSRLALAGALVGFGAKLGNGCTSGHMLCGVSRLSPRSLLATTTFMITAVTTARLFPAPISELAANVPIWPSKAHLVLLGGAVVIATLLREVVARIVPPALKACRECECDEATPPQCAKERAVAVLPYFYSGVTFSLGLLVSGMLSPLKVMGFLRVPPPLDTFDPSLALVMLGGVLPNAIHYARLMAAPKGPKPALPWEKWQVPTRRDIDWRLVTGAALFGVGWGLAGICPGPGLETAGSLITAAWNGQDVSAAAVGWVAYFSNLILGMAAVRGLDRVLA